jgi:hypothetical protein
MRLRVTWLPRNPAQVRVPAAAGNGAGMTYRAIDGTSGGVVLSAG